MLEEQFGWKGPPDEKKGAYDYLPLVIQSDPNVAPEMFAVPLECAVPVHIHHPEHPELSELDMQWYPIPAVCALDMTVGGILYTAVPFNGWYANTEVLRDLTDKSRYNMLVPVAKSLGLDPETKPGDEPLWKDEVMAVLNKAVYHSFKKAKIAMIGHHTLIEMFWQWYNDEMLHRGFCPVNWKWVIPPMSSSTNDAYLGLNKAQEFTLKPAYLVGKGFLTLEREHFGERDTTNAMKMFYAKAKVAVFVKKWIKRHRQERKPIVIIYASVTGNSAMFASKLGSILSASSQVSFFDACGASTTIDEKIWNMIEATSLCIFVASTQGNGELPSLSRKFFSTLFDKKAHLLTDKHCAVLGFGSSAYPIFCGAAEELSSTIVENGGLEVVPLGKCDALTGEETTFRHWTSELVDKLASMPDASPLALQLSERINDFDQTFNRRKTILDSVKVEVFRSEAVNEAVANSFMPRRGSADSSLRQSVLRRGSLDSSRKQSVLRNSINSGDLGGRLHEAVAKTALANPFRNDRFEGEVLSREDLISGDGLDSGHACRQTSLLSINVFGLPYQPGDHVQVYPRNTISEEKLEAFIGNLAGELSLEDRMYVTIDETKKLSLAELAVTSPLLHQSIDQLVPLEYFLLYQASMDAPVPTQSCFELACLATSAEDKSILEELGRNKAEYDKRISTCGLKWMDVFDSFPSLSQQVTLPFLLHNMKMNHPRSYSIASYKPTVGNELHLVVGRFIYSRGASSKAEVGVCSSFLTNANKGDIVTFKIESCPSFYHPLDPSSPIVFICTGTGFAPIRGLLQKRSYLKKRGEKMGDAYLLFGSRSSKEGLFEGEINEFIEEGTLADAFKCYSREPGKKKQYTTDVMRTESVQRVLLPTLESDNCHIYICGSANLAEESKIALAKMTSELHVNKLIEEGRFHCDVFGARA